MCLDGSQGGMRPVALVAILLLSTWSQVVLDVDNNSPIAPSSAQPNSISIFDEPGAVVLPSLEYYTSQEEVEVMVLTIVLSQLHSFQQEHGLLPEQSPGGLVETYPESMDGVLQHRIVTLPGDLVAKLPGVHGVIAIHDIIGSPKPAGAFFDAEPNTVVSQEIHNATVAHDLNITGEGIKVAILDSGIDFAHPDLNGTQARVDDVNSSWDGWPIAFDEVSISNWISDGDAYPAEQKSWYSDTSQVDYDNDSDNLTDNEGIDVTGVTSLSGIYHHGLHPDSNLVTIAGDEVPILVVDDLVSGEYTSVYVDIDLDGRFDDEKPMRKGSETAGLDTNNDGLWDVSAGMIYWIADGNTSLPFAPTYSTRNGYLDRIPNNGELVMFMLNENSGPGGSHGTLCASAVAAQGVVNNGAVKGMAPNATLISVGNYYAGGTDFESWRFVAEGYDGIPDTGDEANIGSFSFGYSGAIDAGSDERSMYLDWLTRVYSVNTTYLVALGNGGHGYGTVASPGGSPGVISVGAASSRTGQGAGNTWGEIASWSDRGPNSQGRMDPDIVAVGWSATGDITLNEVSDANSATRSWSGTSLSTPIAAGLLALVQQAWFEKYGVIPGSQNVRDLVMSTSSDLGYDPNTQGAGWFDAGRAVKTVQGHNGTWAVIPASLMPGSNEGYHRSAGINWMLPGQNSSHLFEIINPSNSSQNFTISSVHHVATSHDVYNWEVNSSNGWDGYQDSRPDKVWPVWIPGDSNNSTMPNDATLLRARASMSPNGFDGNQNLESENRPYLRFYRWNDTDGDGKYWNDSNGDGHVGDGEWEDNNEFSEVTAHMYTSPQVEVRYGMPTECMCDGIILAAYMENVRSSIIDPVPIQIDITSFSDRVDPWVSVISSVQVPALSSTPNYITVSVPSNTTPGLYMSGVLIESENHSWKLPLVTTVAANGPYSWTPPEIDGNLSNQTLYRETWMQGAQRWGWRAESGDWKAVAIDWPSNFAHGKMIVDIDWPDNGFTDIDAHLLSRTTHPYYGMSSDYPNWVLNIEQSSQNMHQGSGIWQRQTNTGEDREILVGDASEGIKQILLHSTMHGVLTNDNPVNISVGHITSLDGNDSWTVSDWDNGVVNETLIVGSTMNLSFSQISEYGWTRGYRLQNQTASQDTAGDVSTASYNYPIMVENLSAMTLNIDSIGMGDDLDLYAFYDQNNNGIIDWGSEEKHKSGNWNSAETININQPDNGQWWIVVHGFNVPSGNTSFWLDVELMGGDDITVNSWNQLNSTEISTLYPNGSSRLGGEIESAWEINFTGEMPTSVGQWSGAIQIELDIGGVLDLPLSYSLRDTPPLVTFSSPQSSSQHYDATQISAYALDIGAGFNSSDIYWNSTSQDNLTITGKTISGVMVNITNLSSSNYTLRELWINVSMSTDGQVHTSLLNVTDLLGQTSSATHWTVHDDENPRLSVMSSQGLLTNQSQTELQILAEEFTFNTLNGIELNQTGSGTGWNNTTSTGAPKWFNYTISPLLEGFTNYIVQSTDRSGRISVLEISIEKDTNPPDLTFYHNYAGIHNETNAVVWYTASGYDKIWLQGSEIDPSDIVSGVENAALVNLSQGENVIDLLARDLAGNWANKSIIIEVDSIFPILDWTYPMDGEVVDHHLLDVRWANPGELAHMQVKINEQNWQSLPSITSSIGRWIYQIESIGEQNLCLRMSDDGGNLVEECRSFSLNESVYTPTIDAVWNNTLVNYDQAIATLYVGPEQTWRLDKHYDGGSFIISSGTGTGDNLPVVFDLETGWNYYTIFVSGKGVERNFDLRVEYDGISPQIYLSESGSYRPQDVNGSSALMVRGTVSEPGLFVSCFDVSSPAQYEENLSGTNFSFPLDPWGTQDSVLLNDMTANIRCTAFDAAGNQDTSWWNLSLDSKLPLGNIEILDQSGRIFVRSIIPIQSDPVDYNIEIIHDDIIVKTLTGTVGIGMEFEDQFEVGNSQTGIWQVKMEISDDVGNSVLVNATIEVEDENTIEESLFSSQNVVNISLGLIVIALLAIMIIRTRQKKDNWQ